MMFKQRYTGGSFYSVNVMPATPESAADPTTSASLQATEPSSTTTKKTSNTSNAGAENSAVKRWYSSAATNVGHVRKINEDSFLDAQEEALWVVADGMGGHSAGDVASQMVIKSLSEVNSHEDPGAMLDEVEDRLTEANRTLFNMCDENGKPKTIGCTVAALLGFHGFVVSVWVGDSRVYRFRDGKLEQISRDHSQVEELVERGEILREDAESHPLANVITRAVGGAEAFDLDVEFEPLRDGDRYLLCSDGLLKDLDSAAIARCLTIDTCADAARALVQGVLEGEAADNVSVAVVDFSVASRETVR